MTEEEQHAVNTILWRVRMWLAYRELALNWSRAGKAQTARHWAVAARREWADAKKVAEEIGAPEILTLYVSQRSATQQTQKRTTNKTSTTQKP